MAGAVQRIFFFKLLHLYATSISRDSSHRDDQFSIYGGRCKQTNKQRSTDNRELSRLNHARARKRTQSPTPGGRGSVSPRLASGAHRWSAPPRAALTLGVVRSMSVPQCALGAAGDPRAPLPWLSSSFLAARVARVCESRELPPARRRVSLRSRRAPLA